MTAPAPLYVRMNRAQATFGMHADTFRRAAIAKARALEQQEGAKG